jgi:hypothetical protein
MMSLPHSNRCMPPPHLHPNPSSTPNIVMPFLRPLPYLHQHLHHPLIPSHPYPHPALLACTHQQSWTSRDVQTILLLSLLLQYCKNHGYPCVFMVCLCATIHFLRRGGSDPGIHFCGGNIGVNTIYTQAGGTSTSIDVHLCSRLALDRIYFFCSLLFTYLQSLSLFTLFLCLLPYIGLFAILYKCYIYSVHNTVPITIPASPCPLGYCNWLTGSWHPSGTVSIQLSYGGTKYSWDWSWSRIYICTHADMSTVLYGQETTTPTLI